MITRRGIGAADLIDLYQIMRGNHTCVGRIELPADALLLAPVVKLIHPLSDDQIRAVIQLRDQIPQRYPDGARQSDGSAISPDSSEMPVRFFQPGYVTSTHSIVENVDCASGQRCSLCVYQADKSFNSFEHEMSPSKMWNGLWSVPRIIYRDVLLTVQSWVATLW